MTRVAVATTSPLAAEAAREVAAAGGNAVDCALAAALLSMNTQPGVCALAGSAFIMVWQDGKAPVAIDGNVAVPGLGLDAAERGKGVERVAMDYGGGIETLVGAGSVAVPGSLAAVEKASQRFGRVGWPTLFAASIRAAREGFPLPSACHYYLTYSGDAIYGRSTAGYSALHEDGRLRDAGRRIVVPGLADTLDAIARDGAALFYEGELGCRIAAHCRDGGGSLTRRDLEAYRAIEREPLMATIGDWQLACNPPPAIGGAMLAALLAACRPLDGTTWTAANCARLVASQRACLDYRKRHLDLSDDVEADVARFLDTARGERLDLCRTSAATVHTSVVDADGTACAVTASSGYGSGEMPAGTGLWLNNCLGEIELNRRGLDAGPPGVRLPSNMAPGAARKPGRVLAVGSPGADRITTALQQFLINHLDFGMPLAEAVAAPRLHIDMSGAEARLMAEPGLPLPATDLPQTVFAEPAMYFGGVAAASWSRDAGFDVAADPRREGGTCVCPG